MAVSIARICDPGHHSIEEAIRQAKLATGASMRFELTLVRFLQIQCMDHDINLPVVFQGLEILGQISEERRLVTLLRPFLRSVNPRVASKAVLIGGRQCSDLKWLINAIDETDDRTRANLIESLWRREGPGVEQILQRAMGDRHQRVAANAVYGLYLRGCETYREGLLRLHQSEDPWFRRSAIWVLGSVDASDTAASLKSFIRDPHPDVRHAAFEALIRLRENGAKKVVAPQVTGQILNLQGDY